MPPKANTIKSPDVKAAAVSVSIRDKTPVKSPSRDYPEPGALAAKYVLVLCVLCSVCCAAVYCVLVYNYIPLLTTFGWLND